MNQSDRRVDHTALKVNQATIIVLLVLAFVLNAPWLVLLVAAVMIVGTIWPGAGLFKLFYARVLRPAGLLQPQVLRDNPEPHLFAQGLGGAFLVAAGVALLALGWTVVGWALTWIVVALAALNLFVGFCAGCFLYYQLNRLGVPRFTRSPLERQG